MEEDEPADISDLCNNEEKVTDKTLMPFGKYKGVELGNIPASYLLWAFENMHVLPEGISVYIDENMKVLEEEAETDRHTGDAYNEDKDWWHKV